MRHIVINMDDLCVQWLEMKCAEVPRAFQPLLLNLVDPDPAVRCTAPEALGHAKDLLDWAERTLSV